MDDDEMRKLRAIFDAAPKVVSVPPLLGGSAFAGPPPIPCPDDDDEKGRTR